MRDFGDLYMGHLVRAAVLVTAALAITSAVSTLLQARALRDAQAASAGQPRLLKLPARKPPPPELDLVD